MATKPSSSNDGFFQSVPIIKNQFHDDPSFQRILKLFLHSDIQKDVVPHLENFGEKVLSKEILRWVSDAERNVPYLKGGGRDTFGRRTSELVVSEGWRKLQDFGIANGIVADGYSREYSEYNRVTQYLKAHLWTGSCANVTCPSAMTDGAAKLLSQHSSSDHTTNKILSEACNCLSSRDPKHAWTSGQWMTERSGGSDVSGTETIAIYSPSDEATSLGLGPWLINGFKWFSSATDSSMSILLAQTPKGLSTFFCPMRRLISTKADAEQELNGIFIQRLKNKFGTKSLPTAELEIVNARAFLVGEEGKGIQEISTILNISRLWSAVSAVGYLGRGLAIARAYAEVREVGAGRGKRVMLRDNPLHMNTLANVTGEYHAMMLFVFFVAWLLGLEEASGPSSTTFNLKHTKISRLKPDTTKDVSLLLRVLTSVLKAAVCKRSIHCLQECMEALGGIGYLDNVEDESLNIARLYRDCCVLSIWEGTTDVLATDTIRVIKGRTGSEVIEALNTWVENGLNIKSNGCMTDEKQSVWKAWEAVKKTVESGTADQLMPKARELVFRLADVVMGILLVTDAESDNDAVLRQITTRYLRQVDVMSVSDVQVTRSVENSLKLNQEIVYGRRLESNFSIGSRL